MQKSRIAARQMAAVESQAATLETISARLEAIEAALLAAPETAPAELVEGEPLASAAAVAELAAKLDALAAAVERLSRPTQQKGLR